MTKSMIQFSFVIAFAFLTLTSTAKAQDDTTLESIIALHLKSIGDVDKIKAVKSMVSEATMAIPTPNGEMEASMKRIQAGNKFMMTMEIPQFGEVVNGSNGDVAWSVNPIQGARLLEGAELEMTKSQMPEPFPALKWGNDFDGEITLQGSEDIDGTATHKVLFAPTEGPAVTRYFDKSNGRIVKMTMTQPSPLGGEMELEMVPSNYKTVDGLSIAHTQVTSTPQGDMTLTIEKLEINADLAEDTFAMPEEIKALVDDK